MYSRYYFLILVNIAFILIFQGNGSCQANFGLKMGINAAHLSFDPDISLPPPLSDESSDMYLRMDLGITLQKTISDQFDLQFELSYLQSGGIVSGNYNQLVADAAAEYRENGDYKKYFNFNYLSLPIVLKLNLNRNNDGNNFFLTGGIEGNYLLQAKTLDELKYNIEARYENGVTDKASITQKVSDDVKEQFSSLAFGAILGFGYRYNGLWLPAAFELRYSLGLNNIFQESDAGSIKSSGLKLSVIIMLTE